MDREANLECGRGFAGDLAHPAAFRLLLRFLQSINSHTITVVAADAVDVVAGGCAAHPVGPYVWRGLQQQVAQFGRLRLQCEGLLSAAGRGFFLAQQKLQLRQSGEGFIEARHTLD